MQYTMYIQSGLAALMVAACSGATGVVKELVRAGADLNLQTNVCQSIIMMYMNENMVPHVVIFECPFPAYASLFLMPLHALLLPVYAASCSHAILVLSSLHP